MPRACSICTHAERPTIDQELAASTSYRDIAQHYGLSKSSLVRHAQYGAPPATQVPGHVAEPAPHSCPCERINWRELAHDAQQLSDYLQPRNDPYTALHDVKCAVAILVKLTASACAQRVGEERP